MTAPTPSDDLQFSTAEPTAPLTPDSDASAPRAAVTCAECAQPIATYYFTAGGQTLCGGCKVKLERALAGEGSSRAGRIGRSLALGFGAALIGAGIWYGIAAAFDLEIGLVAILIGWMVGRAVQMGSGGRGGRRYQVAAALLAYLSIVMSYAALGFRGIDGPINPFMLIAALFLPVVANLASMPGGIIGLAIMGFGIHQAWTMNAPVEIAITGPHRIGAVPDAPAGEATA